MFFPFLSYKYLGVGLLGYTVGVCLTSQETAKLYSKVILPFYAPRTSEECSRSLVPHPCPLGIASLSKTLKVRLLTYSMYDLHIIKFTAFSDEFYEF